jgi:AraC-like DNA-binding protein
LILPDGCLDLIWDGGKLFVAGPDSTARQHRSPPVASYVALRFAAGLGPALLGIPAGELRDRQVDVVDLVGLAAGPGRTESGRKLIELAEAVAVNPEAALSAWLADSLAERRLDPLGPRVLAMARAGTPVAAMANRVGLSDRQLQRRCGHLFGYGPRHLVRVLRLGRALEQARSGRSWARVAAEAGYCDQAHLCREIRALTGTTPTRLPAGSGLG